MSINNLPVTTALDRAAGAIIEQYRSAPAIATEDAIAL
jgi:hypothetical protein